MAANITNTTASNFNCHLFVDLYFSEVSAIHDYCRKLAQECPSDAQI
jgi:uncharacterized protein YpiB (UPF0302 family)